LEARVSKRSVSMRGGISFLMRDAEGRNNYWNDVVPLNYRSGTTKFIMSRNVNNDDGGSSATDYSSTSTAGLQAALKCPPLLEGERQILYGSNGPILVTRVAGTYYAVDATCPHLNLPMKKGKISVQEGKVVLTCSFHNSCFEMKTGKCTKWVTGALGRQNELISGIMSNIGSEQEDINSYHVLEEDNGSLTVTSEAPKTLKIPA
jgi:nitrite reductase/ring-hydroxylating ferredoxin subunit